jgi:5-methylthioadenosine/S-adenosylhomocysteine deaminase
MIRTGTTCFADQYFHMDRVLPVVEASGLRAALAYGVVELGDAAARERELAAAEDFLHRASGNARVRPWIGPHALFVDNAPEAIRRELELADAYDAGLHIHLATSGEEDRFCRERYGHSAVAEMQRLGVLDRRLLAAHCLTVPPEDYPALAAAEFTAVLCPSAAMRSGAAAPPAIDLREAGVRMALGTDNVTNNNSYDLFREMNLTAKLISFRQGRPAGFSARELVHLATRGGARALGLEDQIGSLEPGKQADLIALDLSEIGWAPTSGQDPYTALVYSVSGMHVTDVMVAGHWLYRDRGWTTLDHAASVADLEDAHRKLRRARAEAG